MQITAHLAAMYNKNLSDWLVRAQTDQTIHVSIMTHSCLGLTNVPSKIPDVLCMTVLHRDLSLKNCAANPVRPHQIQKGHFSLRVGLISVCDAGPQSHDLIH